MVSSVESRLQWIPVQEMISDEGTIGASLIANTLDLGVRLRPETTLKQPLKSLWVNPRNNTLAVLSARGFVTVADILKLQTSELASFSLAPKIKERLENYLQGLLIPPHSRLLQAASGREQFPVPIEREQEIVEGVEEVLERMRYQRAVAVFVLRFGLHDGITRPLKEVGKKLEIPVSLDRTRQIEIRGFLELRFFSGREARRYFTIPKESFGRQIFGATLVKDLPLLDRLAEISQLNLPSKVLEELTARTSLTFHSQLEDLFVEDLSQGHQAAELSVQAKDELAQALKENVREMTERLEQQAQLERERRERKPVNNLIPEINLTDEQLETLKDLPIDGLGLSVRAYNSLGRGDIKTIGDLLRMNRSDLYHLRGLGITQAVEIGQKLAIFLELDEETQEKFRDLVSQEISMKEERIGKKNDQELNAMRQLVGEAAIDGFTSADQIQTWLIRRGEKIFQIDPRSWLVRTMVEYIINHPETEV